MLKAMRLIGKIMYYRCRILQIDNYLECTLRAAKVLDTAERYYDLWLYRNGLMKL